MSAYYVPGTVVGRDEERERGREKERRRGNEGEREREGVGGRGGGERERKGGRDGEERERDCKTETERVLKHKLHNQTQEVCVGGTRAEWADSYMKFFLKIVGN